MYFTPTTSAAATLSGRLGVAPSAKPSPTVIQSPATRTWTVAATPVGSDSGLNSLKVNVSKGVASPLGSVTVISEAGTLPLFFPPTVIVTSAPLFCWALPGLIDLEASTSACGEVTV